MTEKLKFLKNKYVITVIVFAVWMLFFDRNDVFSVLSYKAKLNKLNNDKAYYTNEINKLKKDMYELMSNPKNLEKFAREKYLMKKDQEEIFLFINPGEEK